MRNLVKAYGAVEVIHGINLDIREGDLTVLLGPSGCGKSTLLRMIAGLEEITDGSILIDQVEVNDIGPSKRGCAMVFQNYALYPHQTVRQNMAFPLRMAGVSRAEQTRLVDETAALLELDQLLDRLPRDLSGGQRQRVAMGRAMIRQPKVFLFDEPLSNLDAELRVKMRFEISRLHESLSATTVFVTHDQVEAMTLADRIVVMRDGHIEQVGAPLDIYENPDNRFVAGFLGSPSMGFLPVGEAGADGGLRVAGGTVAFDDPPSAPPVSIGMRPEHLTLGQAAASEGTLTLQGQVIGREHLGDRSYVHVDVDGSEVTVLEDAKAGRAEMSETVTLSCPVDSLHLFDSDGCALPRAGAR